MINKPSLLDTPNLINWKEYSPSDIPGSSVDDCYANDSTIRTNYDGTDTSEWNTGKQIQETLPAAEWDAWMHDLNAYGWQVTELLNSIYGELYSFINGQQVGMDHDVLDAFNTYVFNKRSIAQVTYGTTTFADITALLTAGKTVKCGYYTLTSSTGSPASKYFFTCPKTQFTMGQITVDNTDTWATDADITLINTDASQTLTNKTISFDSNTLQNVLSQNTEQTMINKTIDGYDNTFRITPIDIVNVAENGLVTIPNKWLNLCFTANSTTGPYTLSDGPASGGIGYPLQITVTAAAAAQNLAVISFKSANDGGTVVQKTLSAGVHHLLWQDATGWTFYEFSGTYTDNTTFTYLI